MGVGWRGQEFDMTVKYTWYRKKRDSQRRADARLWLRAPPVMVEDLVKSSP